MKFVLLLLGCIAANLYCHAQYVYTIKADSVKLSSACDSTELILMNHTQGINGFLYNTGNGRTVFQRGALKLSDSTFLIGADTLKIPQPQGFVLLNPGTAQSGNPDISGSFTVTGTNTTNGMSVATQKAVAGYLGITSNSELNASIGDTGSLDFSKIATSINTPAAILNFGYNNFKSLSSITTANTSIGIGQYVLDSMKTGDFNIGIGYYALDAWNATGGFNTALGDNSMTLLKTGNGNTAIGSNTLEYGLTMTGTTALGFEAGQNSTGSFNVFDGMLAGYSDSASYNVAIGYESMYKNTSGMENLSAGTMSLEMNKSGSYNTALGAYAMSDNTTGSENTVVGNSTMELNIDGSSNTAMGASALQNKVHGSEDVAIGVLALDEESNGNSNTGVGYGALLNTLGSNNTALGDNAGYSLSSGNYNSAVGESTLSSSTSNSGSFITAMGYYAGSSPYGSAKSNCIYLGAEAGANADTGNYKLYIGSSGTNALYGDMANHNYIINPLNPGVSVGYTLDVQNSNGAPGNLHVAGTIYGDSSALLKTAPVGGSDTKWALPIRDSATGKLVNIAAGTSGQVLVAGATGKPGWEIQGSGILLVSATSATMTAASTIYNITGSSNTAITLPLISTVYQTGSTGNITASFHVKIASANNITVTVTSPNSGATIDGSTSYTFSGAYQSKTFYTDGTNWWVQ